MQRLDDVTGDRIRLSAKQREEQREEMVAQINNLILANNELTREARKVRERLDALEFHVSGLTKWQRLLWLVGRR